MSAAGMLCPTCRIGLAMSERQGIEIDYCPQCRGVWLDRGELDKIIERNEQQQPRAATAPPPPQQAYPQQGYPQQGYPQQSYPPKHGYGQQGYYKRRKSFLEELFD